MTMRAECTGCGRDCSNANATYNGDIYCFGCLPVRKRRNTDEPNQEAETRASERLARSLGPIFR